MGNSYRLGLDIGTSSIGWAAVDLHSNEHGKRTPYQIRDMGVYMFPTVRLDHGGKGSKLAERGKARRMRRTHDRRSHRMERVRYLLVQSGLISEDRLASLWYPKKESPTQTMHRVSVYELRVKGLDEQLTPDELTRVLVFLAKHRGFQSSRKAAEAKDIEGQQVLTAVKENKAQMEANHCRTPGEYLWKAVIGQGQSPRNSAGSYRRTMYRELIVDEAIQILGKQREYYPDVVIDAFIDRYTTLVRMQRDFDTGPGGRVDRSVFADRVGHCSVYPEEHRAPKASYAFEHFTVLTKVWNLRIYTFEEGLRSKRPLTQAERQQVLALADQQPQVTYGDLRRVLSLPETHRFAGLEYEKVQWVQVPNPQYDSKRKKEMETQGIPEKISQYKTRKNGDTVTETMAKTEKALFATLKFHHQLRSVVETLASRGVSWPLFDQPDLATFQNQLAEILTEWRTDRNRASHLKPVVTSWSEGVTPWIAVADVDAVIQELLTLDPSGYGHLSLKALDALLPWLEQGLSYADAMQKIGYPLGDTGSASRSRSKYLPALPDGSVTNASVVKVFRHAREVINAVIRKYGSPESVHIELARGMAQTRQAKDRDRTRNRYRQQQNEANEALVHAMDPDYQVSHTDRLKLRLWKEQREHCIYSDKHISLAKVLSNEVQIDHIIPWSLSFDDSQNNKVLVFADYNQNKQNMTPMEFFRHVRPNQMNDFVNRVHASGLHPHKKELLLFDGSREDLVHKRDQHLNDTKYATRLIANHIKRYLRFDTTQSRSKKRVVSVNGPVTAFLRSEWKLEKDRKAGDRHHAQDAVVIACTDDALIQRITRSHQQNRIRLTPEGAKIVDPATGELCPLPNDDFTLPWESFKTDMQRGLEHVFVARKPRKKTSGQLHLETVYGMRRMPEKEPKRKAVSRKTTEDNAEERTKTPEKYVAVKKTPLHQLQLTKATKTESPTVATVGQELVCDLCAKNTPDKVTPFNTDQRIKDGGFLRSSDRPLYRALLARLTCPVCAPKDASKAFQQPLLRPTSRAGVPQPVVKRVPIESPGTLDSGVFVEKFGGYVAKGGMIRCDVFRYREDITNENGDTEIRWGKWMVVPLYTIHFGLKVEKLPRPEDPHYEFQMSLYPDELVRLEQENGQPFKATYYDPQNPKGRHGSYSDGLFYYLRYNVATKALVVKFPDGNGFTGHQDLTGKRVISAINANGLRRVQKLQVTCLGEIRNADPEPPRQPLREN